MKIVALCPTFRKPAIIPATLALFERQTYQDARLLILDDAGQLPPTFTPRWSIYSTPLRLPTLAAKYRQLIELAPDSDAFAIWDDDDLFSADHLQRAAELLAAGAAWTKPSQIWLEDGTIEHNTGGRFLSSIVFTRAALEAIGGWPDSGRADTDLDVIARLTRLAPPADPTDTHAPTYCFRWASTGQYHAQGVAGSPTWYQDIAKQTAAQNPQSQIQNPKSLTPDLAPIAALVDLIDRRRAEWQRPLQPHEQPPTNPLSPGTVPRVALVHPSWGGGVERWTLDLVAALHAAGRARCEIVLVEGLGSPNPEAVARAQSGPTPFRLLAPEAVEAFLCDNGFHLAISWGFLEPSQILGRFRPNLLVVHGSDEAYTAVYVRAARSIAAHYVGVSAAVGRLLARCGVPADRRGVIPNGLPPRRVPLPRERQTVRQSLGISPETFVVGYLGRLSPEKRLDILVDAMQILGPEYRAVIQGHGCEEAAIRARDVAGRCTLLAHSPDITQTLYAADCFVGLSRDEGFWLSGAEAAQCHVPLIATRVGFLADLANEIQNPPPWIEVPKDLTSDQLAAAIRRCRQSPPDTARLAEAVSRWTIESMAAKWADLIDEITGPTPPSCSILMAVHDTPVRMLQDCWQSILSQTVRDWELVLVDDGSRNVETVELLDRIAADSRVRLDRLPENRGVTAARNAGLRACRADLVAVMDADDIMLPDRLRLQLDWFAAHADTAILGGQIEMFEEVESQNCERITHTTSHPAEITAAVVDAQIEAGRGVWLLNHPTVMYRRRAILDLGGYNESRRRCDDLGLWLRCLRVGMGLRNLPEVILRYRLHPGQLTGARDDHRAEHDAVVQTEWIDHRPGGPGWLADQADRFEAMPR